jgi:hypothetical protein
MSSRPECPGCGERACIQINCRPTAPAPTRPIVIVESRYAGNVEVNLAYTRAAMRDCLLRGEAPFASHALYTQSGVLDDDIPEERQLGTEAGFAFRPAAQRTVVYVDLGYSRGMNLGIAHAEKLGQPVEVRRLLGWEPVAGWLEQGLNVTTTDDGQPVLSRAHCLASDECEAMCQTSCAVDTRYPGVE